MTVSNPQGLHARPADMFVRRALQFISRVEVIRDGERFDGKSILSLMTVAAEQGTELLLEATGPDARQAVDALAELFQRSFDESEITQPAQKPAADG